jgi:DNA polymerase-3 subunit alpha
MDPILEPEVLIPYTGTQKKVVHLHAHTVYSPLDGVATPEQYFGECKDREYPAMAITEHGSLASMPDNYLAAKANV